MKPIWRVTTTCALVFSAFSVPAKASTWLLEFSGTLDGTSFDHAGQFGAANTSLAGQAFTASVAFSDEVYPYGFPGFQGFYWGDQSISVTINGISQAIYHAPSGQVHPNRLAMSSNDSLFGNVIAYQYNVAHGVPQPGTHLEVYASSADLFSDGFRLFDGMTKSGFSTAFGVFGLSSGATRLAEGGFITNTLSVSLLSGDGVWRTPTPVGGGGGSGGPGGVPEPDVWATLIAGFMLTGIAARGRRTRRRLVLA